MPSLHQLSLLYCYRSKDNYIMTDCLKQQYLFMTYTYEAGTRLYTKINHSFSPLSVMLQFINLLHSVQTNILFIFISIITTFLIRADKESKAASVRSTQ